MEEPGCDIPGALTGQRPALSFCPPSPGERRGRRARPQQQHGAGPLWDLAGRGDAPRCYPETPGHTRGSRMSLSLGFEPRPTPGASVATLRRPASGSPASPRRRAGPTAPGGEQRLGVPCDQTGLVDPGTSHVPPSSWAPHAPRTPAPTWRSGSADGGGVQPGSSRAALTACSRAFCQRDPRVAGGSGRHGFGNIPLSGEKPFAIPAAAPRFSGYAGAAPTSLL